MENRPRRILASRAKRRCPCCEDDLESNFQSQRQRTQKPVNITRKRKRSEVDSPSQAPAEGLNLVSSPPESSTADSSISKPLASIQPDLPEVSPVALSPQPSTAPPQDDDSLQIHNHSVEDYQKLYHEVVDGMLRYKNGRIRPYTLYNSRLIKQKLWERLNKPTMTETVDEDGRVTVNMSYGTGVCPPQYEVEPRPKKSRRKRAKR